MSERGTSASPPPDAYKSAASSPAPHEAAPQRHVEPPRVLHGFWRLPKDLQRRIISLACTSDRIFHWRVVGRAQDCTKTMVRLSESCREFNAFVAPILYAYVRLPTPSTLRAFHQTLASRPALGRLVKALHVGPNEALPDYWWPLRHWGASSTGDVTWYLRLNLVRSVDDPRRPWWACPSHEIPTDNKYATGGCSKARQDGLASASRDLNVDLHREDKDHAGGHIGWDAWHVRVLEVQAAMELFCLELHQRDVKERERTGETDWSKLKTCYPRLVVGQKAAASPAAPDDNRPIFCVSRSDLYQRMSRPEAPTDHFNHPLVLARSGLNWIADGPNDREHRGDAPNDELEHEEDPASAFAWPASPTPELAHPWGPKMIHPTDLADPLDPAIPATATVAGNLALARAVLSLTPLISCLSLTSYLEGSVSGELAPPAFKCLRFATFGPPPNGWYPSFQCRESTLGSLEKLQICGRTLGRGEIPDLVGDGAFIKLRELHWSVVRPVDDGDPESLMCIVEQLIGFDEQNAPSAAEIEATGQRLKRSRAVYEEEEENEEGGEEEEEEKKELASTRNDESQGESLPSPGASRERKVVLIKANLHHDDAQMVLNMAPTKKMASAWTHGEKVPGQRHRFQLLAHAEPRTAGGTWPLNEEMADLFEEARRFWEEVVAAEK